MCIRDSTDTVSVMRQGEMTATLKTDDTNPEDLAELMVGRKVLLRVDKRPANPTKPVLEIQSLNMVDDFSVQRLKNINLTVKAGEILGIAGVAGNGQSELLQVLGGYSAATGIVKLNGSEIDLSTSVSGDGQARRALGMAHVPEDRQREGLIMDFMAWENAVFGYHREKSNQANRFFMDNNAIRQETEDKMKRFDVRPPNPRLTAKNFSGGNQQKIVLANTIFC